MKALFDEAVPPPPESEDCLSINIFAPSSSNKPSHRRAVLVFIHGGGFQLGGSYLYDCSAFAAYDDIVAVTFNYRTNIFGFPAATEIPPAERNLGLLDQLFALDWVQRNIAAFGGDPTKVTAWGISSGAESLDSHILNHPNKAPFRAAILESGQSSLGLLAFRPPDGNIANWNRILDLTNCSSTSSSGTESSGLSCLRKIPASKLKTLMEIHRIDFPPTTDNTTMLPNLGRIRAVGGPFARVPVLTGTVAEEGRSLINRHISMSDVSHAFLNEAFFPNGTADSIIASYRKGNTSMTDFDVGAAIFTDFLYQCPTAMLTRQTAAGRVPVWRYFFNASFPAFVPPQLSWLRKYHGVEYPALFVPPYDPRHTSDTRAVANAVRCAWARFVRDPEGGPGWSDGPQFVGVVGDGVGKGAGDGTSSEPIEVVNAGALDGKCTMFQGVLDGMAGIGNLMTQ